MVDLLSSRRHTGCRILQGLPWDRKEGDGMRCIDSNCNCCPGYERCYPEMADAQEKFDREQKAKRERELEDDFTDRS